MTKSTTTDQLVGAAILTKRLGGLAFGGDYNPEQWDPAVWVADMALMREAGVNLVTVGVFAWAQLEPTPGDYCFEWLDEVLDLLHANGIAVDLATATASPPPWFSKQQPQAALVDEHGVVRHHGGRQAYCPSSPAYRSVAAALAAKIAVRYADHPAVVMWHVNNEYGCHNSQCFCPTSVAAFRDWLRNRYRDIPTVNSVWGTSFWSQRYSDFEEIMPPVSLAYNTFANPTQLLDWRRFCSDELLQCYLAEARQVRAAATQPVTTNFMSFFPSVDYFRWAGEVDIVSNDDYLRWDNADPQHLTAMSAELIRSLAGGQPWLLMEHSTSAVNWQPWNPAKPPGMMLRNSLQHIARGSEGALFFQWRASVAGAEKFHSALVPHAGTDTARWREVVALGAVVGGLAPLANSTPAPAEVAILFDWNSWWAAEQPAHPTADLSVMRQVQAWHKELWRRNIPVDFVHPDADLSGYRTVLIPALYLISDANSARIADAVAAGAAALVGYFAGIADQDDHVRTGGYPGAFRELLGVTVEEFDPLPAGGSIELTNFGRAQVWSEVARSDGATVLASYTSGTAADSPAVTQHRWGQGSSFYCGTELTPEGLGSLLSTVLREAGIDVPEPTDGVEMIARQTDRTRWTFVINHTDQPVTVAVAGRNLLEGNPSGSGSEDAPGSTESTRVAAGGVAVIESPTPLTAG